MEIPRHWRLKRQRYNLVGEICPHCEHAMFPPRDVCPNCRGGVQISTSKGDIYQAKDDITSLPTEVSTSSR